MKMSRRKVRETIFLLLFRIEFNTQEELQEQMKWYFEERPDVEAKTSSIFDKDRKHFKASAGD